MGQLLKKEQEFLGKYVCGLQRDFYLDRKDSTPDNFIDWQELTDTQREMFVFVGEAMLNYFRRSEGNEFLRNELERVKTSFEGAMTAARKEHKMRGGVI